MATQKNRESGFTLIEVMIAVMVLTVGLIAAAAMQTRAASDTILSTRMAGRVVAGEQRIEDLMSINIIEEDGYDPSSFFTPDIAETGNEIAGSVITDSTSASHTITYEATTNSPIRNLTTITVNVVPHGADSKRTLTYTYIRSNRWN